MIKIFDTTLRDGEQSPGCSMNLKEKLLMAKQLEHLNVDIIEAGFAISSKGDFESVREISKAVKNPIVASLSRSLQKDIDIAWEAVKYANRPRIHVFLATSPIHMKYKLSMSEEKVLEMSYEAVKYAKKFCSDIEFSAEDATRSDVNFLIKVFEGVIKAGATVINVPDTVGYITPQEYFNLIKTLKENVTGIDKVDISVHCHDDLGMAVANSLSAVKAGATQVECTVNGIGERAGNAALEEIVMAIKTRKDFYEHETNIVTAEIMKTSKLLSSITGVKVQPNKAIVGENAFAHESGIHQHGVLAEKSTYEIMTPKSVGLTENNVVLGKHSGKHALKARLESLGYEVGEEKLSELFESFKALADEKKELYNEDIEALIRGNYLKEEEYYKLIDYSSSTKNEQESNTVIVLNCGSETIENTGVGRGPIDAAFNCLNKITGSEVELVDFNIHSLTKGLDALGETVIKLKWKDKTYTGKGVSTDIIKSSIIAYLNALNTIQKQKERND